MTSAQAKQTSKQTTSKKNGVSDFCCSLLVKAGSGVTGAACSGMRSPGVWRRMPQGGREPPEGCGGGSMDPPPS